MEDMRFSKAVIQTSAVWRAIDEPIGTPMYSGKRIVKLLTDNKF